MIFYIGFNNINDYSLTSQAFNFYMTILAKSTHVCFFLYKSATFIVTLLLAIGRPLKWYPVTCKKTTDFFIFFIEFS